MPSSLSHRAAVSLLTFCYCLLSLVTRIEAISPSFVTSLADCKTGSAVLTVSSPTTLNGYDTGSTSLTFPTAFSQAPNVALGLSYLSSTYSTTTNLYSWLIDLSVTSTTTTTAVIFLNRTSSIISQIQINYLALLSTSAL